MLWLTVLPWRQRNLINIKLGILEDGANLSREEIPAYEAIGKPNWVEDAVRANPHEKIWQFFFREDETKTHQPVRGVVPIQLVLLLEEYLAG